MLVTRVSTSGVSPQKQQKKAEAIFLFVVREMDWRVGSCEVRRRLCCWPSADHGGSNWLELRGWIIEQWVVDVMMMCHKETRKKQRWGWRLDMSFLVCWHTEHNIIVWIIIIIVIMFLIMLIVTMVRVTLQVLHTQSHAHHYVNM